MEHTYTAVVPAAPFLLLASFSLGLLFGSFLNVVISRVPEGRSVVTPRSSCAACGHVIRWYDNVPLLSFALLRARCRDCGAAIPWHYPAVELLTGLWFLLCAWTLVPNIALVGDLFLRAVVHAVAAAVLGFLLIGLAVIDWQHQRLPDVLTIPGILLGLLLTCADAVLLAPGEYDLVLHRRVRLNAANAGHSTGNVFLTGPEHLVFGRLLAVVVAFLLLYGIGELYRAVRGRQGIGLGDAKLLAMLTSFLGLLPTGVALFTGLLLATLYAVALLLRRRADAATPLPFGSFLAMGGLLAALFGQPIADAYLRLFY